MKNKIDSYLKILNKQEQFGKAVKSLLQASFDVEKSSEDDIKAEQTYYLVWAPVITAFVEFVIEDALKQGIRRLYFLARDAYPMYLAAKRIVDSRNIEIDCRYLRVSRQSIRVPEYHLIGKKAIDRIFLSGIDVDLRKILGRARFTEEEIIESASILGVSDTNRILNRNEIMKLKEKAYSSQYIFDRIRNHSLDEYETTVGYLFKKGLLENINYAVVDSGWVGTMQLSLLNVLKNEKKDLAIKGYYFGLYEYPQGVDRSRYTTYYFNPLSGIKRKSHFSNCLFEAIFSENASMTIKYDEEYEPVFSETKALNGIVHEKNEKYLSKWLDVYCQYPNQKIEKSIVEKLLSSIMSNPDDWESEYYGGLRFSDDLNDKKNKELASILSKEEIDNLRIVPKLLVMLGLSKKILRESAWIEGSSRRIGGYKLGAMRMSKLMTVIRQQRKQKCLK